jgi:hypothetical protein
MKTISSKINDAEHKAILEYANECGLTVSELVRKIVIHQICFLDGDSPTDAEYYEFRSEISGAPDTDTAFQNHVNKYRKMLGIGTI